MSISSTVHVLIVVDDSGSMGGVVDDTRGGFNSYIRGLLDDTEHRYRITAVRFSTPHAYQVYCTAAPPLQVPTLDASNYTARGSSTALSDAIGRIIGEFETAVPELDDGDRVLLVVQTDGLENSSREFTTEAVRQLITQREAGGRWSCLYLGAGPDAWGQSGQYGFTPAMTVNTSRAETTGSYTGLRNATLQYARGASGQSVSAEVAAAANATTGDEVP